MAGKRPGMLIAGAIVLGLTGSALAEATSSEAELRAEMDALRTEIAQLKQDQSDNWLNERRAEEVKSLIRDVLADAETRASLLQDGTYAGYNGSHFFLASADGNYLLEIYGQLQLRYYVQWQDGRSKTIDGDDNPDDDIPDGDTVTNDYSAQTGFQLRRAKVGFKGHVINPNFYYKVVLATSRSDGDVYTEDAIMGYHLSDETDIQGGVFKFPFLRQELISSSTQMVMDRGITTEYFTLDRGEQIQVAHTTDSWKAWGSFGDGARGDMNGYTDFGDEAAHFSLTGRFDYKFDGEWSQWGDVSSWSGQNQAIFVGAAMHYEEGEHTNGYLADYFSWTVDGSYSNAGFSFYASYMGGDISYDDSAGTDATPQGILLEAGYMVIPDELQPYIRWEWLDSDVDGNDNLQAVTLGMNYFLDKHNAKLTTDLVIVYDGEVPESNPFGANPFSSGLGLNDPGSDFDSCLVVWRTQFQLLF